MLIRSQDKSRLISLNNTRELRFWECAQGFNITDCVCPIGHYSTREKAMKVLDMIQEAYCDKCGKKFTMCGYPIRWKYHTETIGGEATDEEVERIVGVGEMHNE